MRKPINTNESMLLMVGHLLKFLFICLFSCTVLVVLAGVFGLGNVVLPLYLTILNAFWKLTATLMGVIAILTMLSGLN